MVYRCQRLRANRISPSQRSLSTRPSAPRATLPRHPPAAAGPRRACHGGRRRYRLRRAARRRRCASRGGDLRRAPGSTRSMTTLRRVPICSPSGSTAPPRCCSRRARSVTRRRLDLVVVMATGNPTRSSPRSPSRSRGRQRSVRLDGRLRPHVVHAIIGPVAPRLHRSIALPALVLLLAACNATPTATSSQPPGGTGSEAARSATASGQASGSSQPAPTPIDTGPDKLSLEPFAAGLELADRADERRRRQQPAVRQSSRPARFGSSKRAGTCGRQPFLRHHRPCRLRRRAWPAGPRLPPGLRGEPSGSSSTTRTGMATRSSPSFASSADGLSADPPSEQVLLRVDQPFANHNGGAAGVRARRLPVRRARGRRVRWRSARQRPEHERAARQDPAHRRGRRPDERAAYAIPAGNPFANGGGAPEV